MRILSTSAIALASFCTADQAQTSVLPLTFLWNQNVIEQNTGSFRIRKDLQDLEVQGSLAFSQASDSTTVYGLVSEGDEMTNKGVMISVQGRADMNSFSGQAGSSAGTLGYVSGYFSNGNLRGVIGSATPGSLSNFSGSNTSYALGGDFLSGPASGTVLSLPTLGDTFIAGISGEVQGQVDGNPNGGVVAGVLGIDSATGTAVSYAGYFDGDLYSTANGTFEGVVEVQSGSLLIDSATNPGRTYEITSGSRQEIYASNDLVTYGAGNIEMRPGTGGGNVNFTVADPFGIPFFQATPSTQQAWIGSGGPQPGYVFTVNGATWCSSGVWDGSSRRWKSDIEELEGALDMVMDMRGVRYTYDPTGEVQVGVIAEELGEVLPEAVFFEEDGEASGVQYGRITAVLIEAMQEQQAQIDSLRAELDALSAGR